MEPDTGAMRWPPKLALLAVGLVIIAFLGLDYFVTPAAAQSQVNCGQSDVMIAKRAEKYRELPVAGGQVTATVVIQVFASKDGDFTILSIGTDGTACVLSVGENWEAFQPVPGEPT